MSFTSGIRAWRAAKTRRGRRRAMQIEMELRVRRAKLEDHKGLRGLYEELDALHREGADWLFKEPEGEPRPESLLRTMLEDPATAVFVAEKSECVGLAKVQLRFAPEFPVFVKQQYAVIDELVVRSDQRRLGIGEQLCRACEDWAGQNGACWVQLEVYSFNEEARRFYENCGYAPLQLRLRKELSR